jgi:leader peptidase (prepilin peptidase)/N-methyltransferase
MPLFVLLASFVLIMAVVWIAYIDMLTFRIPDFASLTILIAGSFTIFYVNPTLLFVHLASGVSAYCAFWIMGELLFRFKGLDMLGLGDAKLFGAGAVWVGFMGLPSLLLVAASTGIAYSLISKRHTKRVPFGPFLGLGTLIIWIYGPIGI